MGPSQVKLCSSKRSCGVRSIIIIDVFMFVGLETGNGSEGHLASGKICKS